MTNVDMNSVVPVATMVGEDAEDTALLTDALAEAAAYIQGFAWCKGIREQYFGGGVGGVVGVFLMRIDPAATGVDEWLWVVTGDLPSAYFVVDKAPSSAAALETYCGLMDDWIHAVQNGSSREDVFPVDAAPTKENATMLEGRMEFLRSEVVPRLR